MEDEKIIYICSACKKQAGVKKGVKVPICCEKEMVIEPLPKNKEVPHSEKS